MRLVGFLSAALLTLHATVAAGQGEASQSGEIEPALRARQVEALLDAKSLQGEWRAVEGEWDGEKRTDDAWRNRRLIFVGDEVSEIVLGAASEKQRMFRLRPAKSPKEIDLEPAKPNERGKDRSVVLGIYSLEKGRLRICTASGKRPTNFKTAPGDGYSVVAYERVGPDPTATLEFVKIWADWEWDKSPADSIAKRYLRLAKAWPDASVALAALCWAAINAPKSDAGEEALVILKDGRIARAELGELQIALDLARLSLASLPPLVLDRAKRELDNPRAAALLSWVCMNSIDASTEAPRAFAEAAELIVGHFAHSPHIRHFCEAIFQHSPPWAGNYENHLRTILGKNQDRKVRYRALFALASIARDGGESHQDEALKLYRQFLTDFKEVPVGDGVLPVLLREAKKEIERIEVFGLGMPAPEIAGEDLAGRPMKLSEFRGKVVLISFWATWCGPCMKMIPQERALVARFKGKPFVLVGVNGDDKVEDLQKVLASTEIPWRSFKNKRTDDKPVSRAWMVAGWPTLYLIDHEGIIRGYWQGIPPGDALDRDIDRLVKAALRARKQRTDESIKADGSQEPIVSAPVRGRRNADQTGRIRGHSLGHHIHAEQGR